MPAKPDVRAAPSRPRAGARAAPAFDVVIVGAGPAGLSAALWLGRCGRRTLVLDANQPRNAASRALHGFLTRDGVAPAELRRLARRELARYPSVALRHANVHGIRRARGLFLVTTDAGARFRARLLLLATGRHDSVPAVPGFRRFYGRGVFHCPYCDGWEHRGAPCAVYGHAAPARAIAELLRTWSRDVVICTDGRRPAPRLARAGIPVLRQRIANLLGDARGALTHLRFADQTVRPCRALFFCSDCVQKSHLPRSLRCQFDRDGAVKCRRHAAQGVPGLFVAGNVRNGVHLAITAAAEGAEAALAMNEALRQRDAERSEPPGKRTVARRA